MNKREGHERTKGERGPLEGLRFHTETRGFGRGARGESPPSAPSAGPPGAGGTLTATVPEAGFSLARHENLPVASAAVGLQWHAILMCPAPVGDPGHCLAADARGELSPSICMHAPAAHFKCGIQQCAAPSTCMGLRYRSIQSVYMQFHPSSSSAQSPAGMSVSGGGRVRGLTQRQWAALGGHLTQRTALPPWSASVESAAAAPMQRSHAAQPQTRASAGLLHPAWHLDPAQQNNFNVHCMPMQH